MAYSEASKRASFKYKKENIKRIPFDVQIEQYEQIKAYAEAQGKPVNTVLKEIIFREIGIQ